MAAKVSEREKIIAKPQLKQEKKAKTMRQSQSASLLPSEAAKSIRKPKKNTHVRLVGSIEEQVKASKDAKDGAANHPVPDPLLLNLVGTFLADHGFDSTGNTFTSELKAKCTFTDRKGASTKKADKRTPRLEQIFGDWRGNRLLTQGDLETSSSESNDETSSDVKLKTKVKSGRTTRGSEARSTTLNGDLNGTSRLTTGKTETGTAASSTSSSSSESDSDEETPKVFEDVRHKSKQAVAAAPVLSQKANKLKRKAPSSSSESTSDDSSDARPVKVQKLQKLKPADLPSGPVTTKKKRVLSVPDVSTKDLKPVATLPAKAIVGALSSTGESSDSTSDSSSESGSDSDLDGSPESTIAVSTKLTGVSLSKVTKVSSHSASDSGSTSDSSSDSESSSDSSSDSNLDSNSDSTSNQQSKDTQRILPPPSLSRALSDSSGTISGDSQQPNTTSKPSSKATKATKAIKGSRPPVTDPQRPAAKDKPKCAKPTPLAELSEAKTTTVGAAGELDDGMADPQEDHPSNRYQSYSYADRAYKDLSVTRGKGFTKEKNKKKRGSYRGGAIDTSGGKSFKFED